MGAVRAREAVSGQADTLGRGMVLSSAGQAKAARSRWKPAAIWAAHRQVRSMRSVWARVGDRQADPPMAAGPDHR
jgi:hypothetical protein